MKKINFNATDDVDYIINSITEKYKFKNKTEALNYIVLTCMDRDANLNAWYREEIKEHILEMTEELNKISQNNDISEAHCVLKKFKEKML